MLPPLASPAPELLVALRQAHAELGDIFRLPLGKREVTVVCSGALAYQVLVAQRQRFAKLDSAPLRRLLGLSVLTEPLRARWQPRRRQLQPAFRRQALAPLVERIDREAAALAARWAKLPAGTLVSVDSALAQLVYNAIAQLAFSAPDGTRALAVPLALATERAARLNAKRAQLVAELTARLAARRQLLAPPEDLLQRLLAAPLDDDARISELLTVFAAGYETTASALALALYELARHPAVQQRLREALAASERPPYLQAVIQETLRLYPTIPQAPRVATERLKLAGYEVAKGARVVVSIYRIHRNPRVWQDPDAFIPERFLAPLPLYDYLPYGLGERSCLGRHLAQLLLEQALAQLVRRLQFAPGPEVALKVAIGLTPRSGISLRVAPLCRKFPSQLPASSLQ